MNCFFSYRKISGTSLPWFLDEEANAATEERNRLLETLSGQVQFDANNTKPYTNSLSPGCEICRNGDWDCNLINRLCTRNCYFCKRYHSVSSELDSMSEGYIFPTPEAHLDYIKIFQIKGVGFSGGEPLLVKERLLSHIRAIRKEFGRSIYLWMYTNGDLADRKTLMELKDAGLDEIRFNLCAREYDLSPVIIAKEYLPCVTVEMPAIPEDVEMVKGLLMEMESAGVDFLNLHQLSVENQNCRAMLARNYHMDCSAGMGIYESEMAALNLLLYASSKQLRLPINYCSSAYKSRFQKRGFRIRKARAVLEPFQEITDAGFIRLLWIYDSADNIKALIRQMTDKGAPPSLWKLNEKQTAAVVHSSLMAYVDWSTSRLTFQYLEPGISLKKMTDQFNKSDLKPYHRLVRSATGLGKESFECWYKHHIGKKNDWQTHPSKKIAAFEEIQRGFPDIC